MGFVIETIENGLPLLVTEQALLIPESGQRHAHGTCEFVRKMVGMDAREVCVVRQGPPATRVLADQIDYLPNPVVLSDFAAKWLWFGGGEDFFEGIGVFLTLNQV